VLNRLYQHLNGKTLFFEEVQKMKKILALILVLGLVSVASAALPADDFEAPKVVGALDGQGGGTGFTNNWYGEDPAISVASETDNQFWRYTADGSTWDSYRLFDPLEAGGQYTIYLNFRASQKGGNEADEWATNSPGGFQLRQDGGPDPLHLKVNQSSFFYLNDGGVMGMDDVPDAYTAGFATQEEEDDFFMNYVDQWAPWKFDLDLTAGTVDWYWMDNNGAWDLVASRGMGNAGDVSATTINRIYLGGKCNVADVTIDYDNFAIVPEPMTLSLLGLGSLVLIRRKR
jgi:hypothetical protein